MINITEIQRITDYQKQLYTNKMDNPEEMNTFLEKYNPPILNQEEIKNTNKSIISNEIKLVITKKQKTTLNKPKSRTRWFHW